MKIKLITLKFFEFITVAQTNPIINIINNEKIKPKFNSIFSTSGDQDAPQSSEESQRNLGFNSKIKPLRGPKIEIRFVNE